ncbi:cation/H(+) antiporter 15-like [Camellia sinensis]|uniref:cation/H(+) antiporter 15-like n=1 Tax=Camellia sinensis TaxID=4442 RepID=UPI0010363AD6|nr:cation/H(+) antiporter 15-like [Camellia sinensis]
MDLKTLSRHYHIPIQNPIFKPHCTSHLHSSSKNRRPSSSRISANLRISPATYSGRRSRLTTCCISPSQEILSEDPEIANENVEKITSNSPFAQPEETPEETEVAVSPERQEFAGDRSIWDQILEIVKFSGPATGLWICGPLMSLIDTAVIGQGSSLELAALGQLAREVYENIRREASCLIIQRDFCMHLARKAYKELCSSAISIQADMRGMVARDEHRFRRQIAFYGKLSLLAGGVVLGPSILGQSEEFAKAMFPLRSVMVLETMANVGLLYFLFLIEVEMDPAVIHRTGRKALAIAIGGMILPFIIGISFSFILQQKSHTSTKNQAIVILFLGVALSVTAFLVFACILAELKLLSSNIARIAMASTLINDVCAWILLAIAIALAENDTTSMAALWVIVSSVAFVVCCIFLVRPLVTWMMKRTPEGEAISEFYVCLILTGVMVAGFITDAIGTHSVFGAFMFGLVIPNGQLSAMLVEKLEDFVSGLLLPLFFSMSGLKTNFLAITRAITWGYLILVIVLAFLGKITGTLVVAMYYQMPFYEAFTLGLLMNTKGLVEMIVLNVGREQQVLDDRAFAIMTIVAVAMTTIITPIVTTIYKPSKRFAPYKRRSIQILKPEAELRVLVCIHTPRNVPTIIKLLEASHPTKNSPFCIYVLHLVELTDRVSAMLIVHSTQGSGSPALNRTQAQSNQIINAFENFKQRVTCVSVNPLTAISPYTTMHEDICNLAEDKHVAFIIIPFHKQQTVDGGMQVANAAFRFINQNVLANAPCSVGILVDRGLTGSVCLGASNQVSHQVAVMFFGGADDREALSYAWRMSEHPGISLTVMRFIAGDNAIDPTRVETSAEPNSPTTLTVVIDSDRDIQLDEDYIKEFRARTVNDSIIYKEKVVNNGTWKAGVTLYDLFIVGRGQGMVLPLTAGLTDWSECLELGAIGVLLASLDFAATMSVLVVQQYLGNGHGDGLEMPNSPIQHHEQYSNFSSHRPRAQALFYE